MLERYAVKVARTVLRGGCGIAATPLPDQDVRRQKIKTSNRNKKRSGCCKAGAIYFAKFVLPPCQRILDGGFTYYMKGRIEPIPVSTFDELKTATKIAQKILNSIETVLG